jgi:3-oxoacyl-[acyl-carrier protein] reductase
MGQIDILVCNAGITKDNLMMRMSNDDFEQVLKVNLNSVFILNKFFSRKMMKQKWGRIINITSVVAVSGNPGQANYCASKAGMIGMSKSLAQEIASRGVTVNCVAPGFITSDMTNALTQDQKDRITVSIPADRMGDSTDIAAAVLYLASKEASYVNGHTLHVNGGLLMV